MFTLHNSPAFAMPGGGGCSTTPLTFTVPAILDFDTINGLTGRANLGSDGTMTYSGGMTGTGLGIGGQITVSGEKNCDINISCTATGTISDGSNTVTVDSVEISWATAAAFGAGTACQGLGNTIMTQRLHTLEDKNPIFIGGSVDGTSTVPCCQPTFNTTNTNGVPITIQIDYQNP